MGYSVEDWSDVAHDRVKAGFVIVGNGP